MIPIPGVSPIFQIPSYYGTPSYNIYHDKTILRIDLDGNIHLILDETKDHDQNVKSAVLALINFCLAQEARKFEYVNINDKFEIDITLRKIIYTGDKVDEIISEVIDLFNKYGQLKVFW
jgi:hypothetical protein